MRSLRFSHSLLFLSLLCLAFVGLSHAAGQLPGPTRAARPAGGLNLTGRALVALPADGYRVYLTWRCLKQDAAETVYEVRRSSTAGGAGELIAKAHTTTTYLDDPGPGSFTYQIIPRHGGLDGITSNSASVTTSEKGRDWVEILPGMRGRDLQFSDRHFADTDGDGELDFVTYSPQVPSYRGSASPVSYRLQVFSLFGGDKARWEYDTGMGTQTVPFASGDKRMDWDYEWTFKPVAWDIDGDHKAEIITLVKRDGKYRYAILKDRGDHAEEAGFLDSPIPVGVQENNNRHFPFFAHLGGKNYSFLLQSGTYQKWEMWAYDWNGSGFDLRWHVDSTAPGFTGNRSSSHTILVMDLDGDGLDEINNGATVLDHRGQVRWTANGFFQADTHIDGQVIDDIDPTNPGLEIMMHEEQGWNPNNKMGNRYALYAAATGRLLWARQAPGAHLQLNIAFSLQRAPGMQIVGTWGGHRPKGSFAVDWNGRDLAFQLPELPIGGDRLWSMDWLGDGTKQLALNGTRVYGQGGALLFEAKLSDAPTGTVIRWGKDMLHHLWFNVDIVGDHREDIPIQMADGSVRVYVNTQALAVRRPCKWQTHSYQMMQAPGDYRYFIAAHEP